MYDYLYQYNTSGWGWVHIILGVVLAVVNFGLFWGTTRGRVAAIIAACLAIVAMCLWLPYYPVWAVVLIALDLLVIWGVATWDPPRLRPQQ